MEHAGVSHIAIHCRTIQQRNEPPDYSAIKLVKDAVQIPIFANGNCKSFLDALEISKLTGADGVMAANGLLDNPALFGGHSTTPKQCVLDWLRLEETENVPFDYFHHLLVFMLRLVTKIKSKYIFFFRSSLSKQQRKIFNNLRNSTDVREFLSNHYFIDSITL
jgi:tRNA-dihydrouridine synthase 4